MVPVVNALPQDAREALEYSPVDQQTLDRARIVLRAESFFSRFDVLTSFGVSGLTTLFIGASGANGKQQIK